MAEQSKIEEFLKRKKEAEEKLATLQAASKSYSEEIIKQKEEVDGINKELDNLRNPNNSIFKAISRAGEKASNVVRNVRLSIMSDDDLKTEYQIYERINNALGDESVSFDIFKQRPEDFMEKSAKPTTLRKVEDTIKENAANFNSTFQDVVKSSEANIEKANVLVENVVQKAAPAFSSFKSFLGNSIASLSKQATELVNTAVDEYKKAEREVTRESEGKSPTTTTNSKEVEKTKITPVENKGPETSPVPKNDVKVKTTTVSARNPKNTLSKSVDNETLLARRKLFQAYKKVVDQATTKGNNPSYVFEDYKVYAEGVAPKNAHLTATTFRQAVSASEAAKLKRALAREANKAKESLREDESSAIPAVTKQRKPS